MDKISILKFFSWDAAKSKTLEARLLELKNKLKQITTDASEDEIAALQRETDSVQKEAQALRTVKLKIISTASFKALPHIKLIEMTPKQEFEQRKAVILHCAEITLEKFNTLHTPDFLQLYSDIIEFILTPSDELQGKKLSGDRFEFDLLDPFENEAGEKFARIKFQVPKVSHSEALAKIEDDEEIEADEEREDFMFRVVTGLQKADFQYLSLRDYLALKPQVGAFFQQSAAFFHPATLNL
ncbi:phage tail assembly protein [Vibrio anguillarum]|uniref:phage tail assembly protein n=1 Tax=Vibrio anguillarum TaxID=55601 RepID=UPI001AD83918|nr:phage tail assembly protein [Vibrio anguillarum]MBT2946352.1 phage tail assembly protein [Vibrio anguillarum]